MSDYQSQYRLYHYKSYCKYSQLYEAVMGRTKDLNEVTKSLILSLFMLLESSEKTLQAMWAAAKPPSLVSSCYQRCCFERPGGMWEIGENHPTRWQIALRGEKSLLQPPFVVSEEMGFHCRKPATKPLLNRKHKLKRLQWANIHKDCTKTAQKCTKMVKSHF